MIVKNYLIKCPTHRRCSIKKCSGVPWWLSRLRIWHCHCHGLGHWLGNIHMLQVEPKTNQKNKLKKILKSSMIAWHSIKSPEIHFRKINLIYRIERRVGMEGKS